MRAAEALVQERVKYNLPNYIPTVFNQVKESIKAYQLNVKGNISSLQIALTQDIQGIGARITKYLDSLDRVRRGISD